MSTNSSLFTLAAAGITAFTLVAAVFVTSDFAAAGEVQDANSECTCPNKGAKSATKPKFAAVQPPLDESDEMAALESLQFALTEVADGSTYVWHRSHGRLSGLVKPTASFKHEDGSICRRALVVLSATETTRKTETVACRLASGIWEISH